MAVWSDGYITEIQYTGRFYPELSPGYLAFACLRQAIRPPRLTPGATYLELGCGQGFGLNLLAAANPDMTFWGVDFHPGQVDNARRLAEAAGLANVTFEDFSFEQVLDLPEGRLPKCDVIALHGIMSWISPENRALIVRILDRLLKPGGMAYVSYNALPGWSSLVPLQHFVSEFVARQPGPPQASILPAFRAASQMLEAHAFGFESIAGLKSVINDALGRDPAYLVHEYLNAHAQPFFHADMARLLEPARLTFVASASIADDLVRLAAPAEMQALVLDAQDPIWRETLLDFARPKTFRRDIFVRGPNALSARERDALLEPLRFTLITAPDAVSFEFPVPIGTLKGQPATYQPIVDALAQGPRTYGELARLPAFADAAAGTLLQALVLLVGARRIHPLVAGEATATQAPAFNRELLDRIAFDVIPSYLACPGAGTGIRVEFADLLAVQAAMGGDKNPKTAAAGGWATMSRTNRRMVVGGQVQADPAANQGAIEAHMAAFFQTKLPLFQSLGVL